MRVDPKLPGVPRHGESFRRDVAEGWRRPVVVTTSTEMCLRRRIGAMPLGVDLSLHSTVKRVRASSKVLRPGYMLVRERSGLQHGYLSLFLEASS